MFLSWLITRIFYLWLLICLQWKNQKPNNYMELGDMLIVLSNGNLDNLVDLVFGVPIIPYNSAIPTLLKRWFMFTLINHGSLITWCYLSYLFNNFLVRSQLSNWPVWQSLHLLFWRHVLLILKLKWFLFWRFWPSLAEIIEVVFQRW